MPSPPLKATWMRPYAEETPSRNLGVDLVMPRGVRSREDLATFRRGVPDIPLMVIAGADDITVEEYRDLGCQFLIYATSSIHRGGGRHSADLREPARHWPHRHQRPPGGRDARRGGGPDQACRSTSRLRRRPPSGNFNSTGATEPGQPHGPQENPDNGHKSTPVRSV